MHRDKADAIRLHRVQLYTLGHVKKIKACRDIAAQRRCVLSTSASSAAGCARHIKIFRPTGAIVWEKKRERRRRRKKRSSLTKCGFFFRARAYAKLIYRGARSRERRIIGVSDGRSAVAQSMVTAFN